MLPYKIFQLGDIVANLLGAGGGLFFAWHGEKRWRARRELERLYAPLDAEEYGDFDVEDNAEELDDVPLQSQQGGRLKSSLKQPTAAGGREGGAGGKKKARFGSKIWDDTVDEFPSSSNPLPTASSSAAAAAGEGRRREDLFSIDDEDESDSEAGQAKAAIRVEGDGGEVWRDAK